METLHRPRLRLPRRSPSPANDDNDDQPTPRILPKHFPDAADTPAARLRALLAREPRSHARPSTPPSDAESAAGPPRFGSSTSSVTRDSLKHIFSRALRDPGDTPQKRPLRRNSFDGSSMEITPVADKAARDKRRAARRSLSDEEAEKPGTSQSHLNWRVSHPRDRPVDPSFRLSTALTFDSLRARLLSSRSQLVDQNPPEALHEHSSLASNHPLPHPSFQISSQLACQSNLLDQDSEMHRAMGDVLNSENEASTSAPAVAQSDPIPSGSRPSASLPSQKTDHPHEGERIHQRERERNRPRVPSRSGTPETHHRHSQDFHRRLSQEFRPPSHSKSVSHESVGPQSSPPIPAHRRQERRGSIASLRSFDDGRGSGPSSIGSQADYMDRITELDREKTYEREREWNKRHPPSRPSSSLSTSSSHSFSHSHSHPPRSPSATPYLSPTHASLQRKSSRTSFRSDSPASLASSHDSLKEREQEETKEVVHERERNWNSPRPHWSTSSSHMRSRNSSLPTTPSSTRLGGSNGRHDAFRVSTKVQSTSPNGRPSSVLLHKSGDRPHSNLDEGAIAKSPQSKGSTSKTPGAASKFGWNFARSPLPPLEPDDLTDHRRTTSSSTSAFRSSSGATEVNVPNRIPVNSRIKNLSHAASDMSLTHVVGDESSFPQNPQHGLGDFVGRSHDATSSQGDVVLGSDDESIVDLPPQSTTPNCHPPNSRPEEFGTDTETEVLTSPSPPASPQLGAQTSILDGVSLEEGNDLSLSQTPHPFGEELSVSSTPPGTPPATTPGPQLPTSEVSLSFDLVTPPRRTSFSSSTLDFRTPSPPHDLPDLPAPPSSSDDDALGNTPMKDQRFDVNSNFTLTKTPRPPGAWAATPLPPKVDHRSSSPAAWFPLESTPPASTSTPLPRASSHPHTRVDTDAGNADEDGLLTPIGTLSRARSLPLRTPAPPGAWMATPGQSALLSNVGDNAQYGSLSRRKGLLKVRFDVADSEASATEGHSNSPLSAIRLTNPDLPSPRLTAGRVGNEDAEAVVNEIPQSMSISVPQKPVTPERPTTPVNGSSSRSVRKSPAVRVVDAYGRERADEEDKDAAKLSTDLQNGHADARRKATTSPSTPRRSLVRIVDAMGREVDDTVTNPDAPECRADRSFETDVSVVSDDIGHAEALIRMRKTLKDLAESLSDADKSEDLELNSSHLEQLEDVSKAARLARNQLAHNLHLETEKQVGLHHGSKSSVLTREPLPVATRKSWNATVIYCGVVIQLIFVLVMWRFAHAEARRLFYTTYYDPLYPEFTPVQESSCFSGTLSTSRSWTMLDSYDAIRREGWWSIGTEILRAMRHVGDQAWERWGEHAHFEKPT